MMTSMLLFLAVFSLMKDSVAVPRWQTRFGNPTKYMEIGSQERCEECLVDVLRIRDDPWWCNHEVNACCFSFYGENLDALQYNKPKQPEFNFLRRTTWCCEHCIGGVGQHEQGVENPWDCNYECGRCCYSWYGQSRVFAESITSEFPREKESVFGEKFGGQPEFRS